jgi:hypothetical protein
MSGRNSSRPVWAVLLLIICLVALGFHFVGESLTHTAAPAVDSPHPGYDLAEDQFVLTSTITPSARSSSLWGAAPLLQSVGLASLAPSAPPPNL